MCLHYAISLHEQAYLEDSHARNFRASVNDVGRIESILCYRSAKASRFNAVKENCTSNFFCFLFQVCHFKVEEYKRFQIRTRKMNPVSWLHYEELTFFRRGERWLDERIFILSRNEDFCADQHWRLYSIGNDLYIARSSCRFIPCDEMLIAFQIIIMCTLRIISFNSVL
jgi:hypothetical protein